MREGIRWREREDGEDDEADDRHRRDGDEEASEDVPAHLLEPHPGGSGDAMD